MYDKVHLLAAEHGPRGGDELNLIKKVVIMDGHLFHTVSHMAVGIMFVPVKLERMRDIQSHLLIGHQLLHLPN